MMWETSTSNAHVSSNRYVRGFLTIGHYAPTSQTSTREKRSRRLGVTDVCTVTLALHPGAKVCDGATCRLLPPPVWKSAPPPHLPEAYGDS